MPMLRSDFTDVPEAVRRIIEQKAPGLIAEVERDELETPFGQRHLLSVAPRSPTTTKRIVEMYDHPRSVLLRTYIQPRRERRQRRENIQAEVEQRLWESFIEGVIPLVIWTATGPVQVPPKILEANGQRRVMAGEDVHWWATFAETDHVTGAPLIAEQDICKLLHTLARKEVCHPSSRKAEPAADARPLSSGAPSEAQQPKTPPMSMTTAPIVIDGPPRTASPARQDRLAIRNKPGGGGKKMAAAIEAMVLAVKKKEVSFERLRTMKQKELESVYPKARRTTLAKAQEAALQQLAAAGYCDKATT